MVGQAGLEPATPRLSSACSNQLSYRPEVDLKSQIRNLKNPPCGGAGGGTGIRTPDFQLAKLALYQLSYTPFLGIERAKGG